MELRHFRYFVAVAEEENITRAAARLYMSQPPLSRQISDLERELGVKLFDRDAKAVRLTEAGRIFLIEIRSVLRHADEAVALIKTVALGKRGQIHVGYAATPTAEILPRTMRLFQRSHPQIRIDLREMSTQGMLDGLRNRTLDAALIVSIAPHDFVGLAVEELGCYPVRIAMHRKHRFVRLRDVPMRQIAKEPLVTYSRKEYPEAYAGLLKILLPYNRSPKIVEEYHSPMSLIAAVEAGRGVALDFQSLSFIAGDRLVLRPLSPAPLPLPIAIACHTDGVSAATAAFVAAAKAVKAKQSSKPSLTV